MLRKDWLLIVGRGWERDGKKEEMGTGSENEMPKYFSEYTHTLCVAGTLETR